MGYLREDGSTDNFLIIIHKRHTPDTEIRPFGNHSEV